MPQVIELSTSTRRRSQSCHRSGAALLGLNRIEPEPSHLRRHAVCRPRGAIERPTACFPGDGLLDRLGRSMEDCVARVAGLLDDGIHVRTLDGRVDTKGLGKMAKLVVGILAAAAEIERE